MGLHSPCLFSLADAVVVSKAELSAFGSANIFRPRTGPRPFGSKDILDGMSVPPLVNHSSLSLPRKKVQVKPSIQSINKIKTKIL